MSPTCSPLSHLRGAHSLSRYHPLSELYEDDLRYVRQDVATPHARTGGARHKLEKGRDTGIWHQISNPLSPMSEYVIPTHKTLEEWRTVAEEF